MAEVRAKWLAFYSEHVEPVSKEIFSHVEKMIIGTLIVSAGAHVSSSEPAIVLFGYLRHGLVGRGVDVVRRHSPGAEFPRRPLQARQAQLAYCVPNRDGDPLCRPVGHGRDGGHAGDGRHARHGEHARHGRHERRGLRACGRPERRPRPLRAYRDHVDRDDGRHDAAKCGADDPAFRRGRAEAGRRGPSTGAPPSSSSAI